MGNADYYTHGDYNVVCDICGQKFKGSKCRMQWNNLFVCKVCFEPRNPQDFVKGIRDEQKAPIPRPDSTPVFITKPITPGDL